MRSAHSRNADGQIGADDGKISGSEEYEARGQASSESSEDATAAASWRKLFYFTTKANLPVLFGGIAASIISGAVSPAQSFINGRIFDRFTTYAAGKLPADQFMKQEQKYVLYLLIVSGVSWITLYLEMAIWIAFGELQAKSARDRLFYGLLKKEIAWYDLRKHGIGALLPRLQAQIRSLQLATSQPLGAFAGSLATAILSLIQAFVLSWKLTLVTLSTAPVIMMVVVWIGSGMQDAFTQQDQGLTAALKHATNAFHAIETVKCFNAQEIEQRKYTTTLADAAIWYYKATNANAQQMALVTLLSTSMFVQGFYYGSVLIAHGETSTANVITTFMSAISAFQSISAVLPQLIVLEKGRNAGSVLRTTMAEIQRDLDTPSNTAKTAPRSCHGRIKLKNVTFAYPGRPDVPALRNVSMFIPGGDMTFLIGKSGSGKSTLGQLLMRFYDSSQGSVSLDGVPLKSLPGEWLRKNITLVEQTSSLFNDTIFCNIALGKTKADQATQKEVMAAAQFALLKSMIHDLPEGANTLIGYKGSTLSGGQRQRMALARARLRDTPILILDESTSALDRISCTLMMDAIRQWRKGKTTIFITHDISQILPDDYVYILQNGSLVQEGYRKHIEKLKDTPFQSFLLDEPRTLSSVSNAQALTYDGSSPTKASPWNIHARDTYERRRDPLELQLDATENRRATFLPSMFNDGSPLISLRTPSNANTSLWTRLASSPSQQLKTGFQSKDGDPLVSHAYGRPSIRRTSVTLENFMQHSANIAVGSRKARGSGLRKRTRPNRKEIPNDSEKRARSLRLMQAEDEICPSHAQILSLRSIMNTLWPSLNRSTRVILCLGFWSATVQAVSTPMFAYVLSKLLKIYSIPGGDKDKSLMYAMIILGISVVDSLHTYAEHFFLEYAGQRWIDAIRGQAMTRILDQPRAFFGEEENSVSRLIGSLDRNAEEMRNLLGRFAALTWVAALMCIVTGVWAIVTQWKLALIALATAPYILGVAKAFGAVSGKWEQASNDASDEAAAIFTETFTNIKTVRGLALEQHFIDKYIRATKHVLSIGFRRAFYAGFFFGLSDSAGNFSIALIFYVGARLVKSGVPAEHIIQVIIFLMFAITNLNMILGFIPQVTTSKDLASRLLRLAQLQKDSHEYSGDTRISDTGDIVFDDLQFAYPSRPDLSVLKHLNLQILPGTCTAIVGGSGSGKSTIANLLLRLYSTSHTVGEGHGRVHDLALAGRNVKRIDTAALRSLIVPVSQTTTLLPATVSENIAYGLSMDSPCNNPATISTAARQAGIHDFIDSLPQSYSTAIGDGGLGLSGGQAQRIAIARALVRKPSVLILDEATSALDVESADLVRETIENLVKDRAGGKPMTVIIITHSREMMEIAENVVVLESGRIVEQGRFEALMQRRQGALVNLLSGGEWTGDAEDS